MKIKKTDYIQDISIKAPRWHDRTILIATFRVSENNVIRFTEAPTLSDRYFLSGVTIRKYQVENMRTKSGGIMRVYAVPMDELIVYEGTK